MVCCLLLKCSWFFCLHIVLQQHARFVIRRDTGRTFPLVLDVLRCRGAGGVLGLWVRMSALPGTFM